jgi:cytochrome c-type biogenesis protein CcmH/NrfG
VLLDKKKVGYITKIGAVFLALVFAATFVPLIAGQDNTTKQPTQQEQMKQMIDALELAAEKSPKSENAWLQLADAHFSMNKFEDAIKSYRKAAELAPKDIKPHFGISVASYNLGQIETATAEINQVIKIDPKNAAAYYNLGLCLTAKGDTKVAISNFEKYIAMEPKGTQVQQAKDQIAAIKKAEKDAASAFETAEGTGDKTDSEKAKTEVEETAEKLKTKSLMGGTDPNENKQKEQGGFISVNPEEDVNNPHGMTN